MKLCYKFNAIKGIQAKRDYFVTMIPLKMLSELFDNDEECVSPEFRAQRKLNESRVPNIRKYILENRDNYVFSSLAASVDGNYIFYPLDNTDSIGILEIRKDSKFLINDGQHRRAAMIEAVKVDKELGEETIPVVLFFDQNLSRSQQIFTDLNKNAVKTSNSISKLYDNRDELSVLTRKTIYKIEFFNIYTDKEKDNLGKFSSHLFTLNTFHKSNKIILKNSISKDSLFFLYEFWLNVAENMMPWKELDNKMITKLDLRQNYICTQNVFIHALGKVGNYFYEHRELDMVQYLKCLRKIDWNRNSKYWYMRVVNKHDKIMTNSKSVLLISNLIKTEMGINLDSKEIIEEKKVRELQED